MLTEEGPKVLGYKATFGETEAQALLPLLSWDSNLEDIMIACVQGRLRQSYANGKIKIKMENRRSAVVVLAAPDFPQDFRTNLPIYMN
jgi:phosphoribosylamine--glycine ligase